MIGSGLGGGLRSSSNFAFIVAAFFLEFSTREEKSETLTANDVRRVFNSTEERRTDSDRALDSRSHAGRCDFLGWMGGEGDCAGSSTGRIRGSDMVAGAGAVSGAADDAVAVLLDRSGGEGDTLVTGGGIIEGRGGDNCCGAWIGG